MNIKQADEKTIKLINYYSISGNKIPENDPNSLDYRMRLRLLYDAAQKEIATTSKKIRKVTRISQNPIPSQLPNQVYSFDVQQHLDADIKTVSCLGSQAYTFKVDNIATVFVEESSDGGATWNILDTIIHTTPIGEFVEYKGLIIPSQLTNLIRIRFSGPYPYNYRDVALFKYKFPTGSAVPQYTRYNYYTMPDDFYQLNKITLKGNKDSGNSFKTISDFYWQKRNILAVNYYVIGEYTVDYFAYPKTIDDDTDENEEFEVDVEAQEAIPYYAAAHLKMDEDGVVGNKLYSMYQSKLANLDDKISNGSSSVSNTLFSASDARLF